VTAPARTTHLGGRRGRHAPDAPTAAHVATDAPLVVVDLVVRRTARGHLEVVFPTRRDARGREHSLVRPIDRAAREAIRMQVLAAAGLEAAL
jgi:DNA-binding cell septation regulator SpoVG